jgi:hypothetical protein
MRPLNFYLLSGTGRFLGDAVDYLFQRKGDTQGKIKDKGGGKKKRRDIQKREETFKKEK